MLTPTTVPVLLTYYYLTINLPADAEAYERIQAERKTQLALLKNELWEHSVHYDYNQAERDFQKKLRAITDFNPNTEHGSRSKVIDLETKTLFENQWNTAPIPDVSETGLRVFHAFEYVYENPTTKEGYYLTLSPYFMTLLTNTYTCGYCAKQTSFPSTPPTFCPHCLDSEYLTTDSLYLLRMKAVSDKSKRQPLTQEESDLLLPLFKQAQIHGNSERGIKRIQKQIEDLHKKRIKVIQNIEAETDGLLWLLERGIKIDNVIYYDHKQCFSFGWRKPVDDSYLSDLLDVISEFRYPYEIIKQDGTKLNGNIG